MLSNLRDAIFRNLGLKLLALLIALGAWFYANSQTRDELAFTARVQINPPPGYTLVHQSERRADVLVAGPRWLMSTVRDLLRRESEVRMRAVEPVPAEALTTVAQKSLQEEELNDGWAELDITPEWMRLSLPPYQMVQLSFLNIQPAQVRAYVSPEAAKRLPVEPTMVGRPPEGLRLTGQPRAVPQEVTAHGPQIALQQLEAIPTEEITLWDKRENRYRERVELRTGFQVDLPGDVSVPVELELSEAEVEISFQVTEEAQEERTIPELPVSLVSRPGFPYQAQIEEDERTVSVTLRGSVETLNRLTTENVRAEVSLTPLAQQQIAPGESAYFREQVEVYLPAGSRAEVVQVQPQQVTVVLQNPAQ